MLVLPLELLDKMIDHPVVKIFTTKMSISSRCFHFKHSILNAQNGNIKGSTTQVKDQDMILTFLALLVVQSISNGSSSWLIDDPHDIKACNDSSIFGSLAL